MTPFHHLAKISLTEAQRRGLETLARLNKRYPLVRTNQFGEEMWADRTCANGYHGSNCSAPFARPAGRLLAALKRHGLVEYHVWTDPDDFGWRITLDGQSWLHPIVIIGTPTASDER